MPLLTPWFVHAALDAAGSADRLGLTAEQANALSDRSVEELVLGPGTFELAGPDGEPFYDPDERGHLADARYLLGIFMVAGGVSLVTLAFALQRWPRRRTATWRLIGRTGLAAVVTVVVLGLVSLVAFDQLFTLFHQVFFPRGNWSFDPATQHLVQLYPFGFWQIASAALGILVFIFGLATWLLGRSLSRRTRDRSTPSAAAG